MPYKVKAAADVNMRMTCMIAYIIMLLSKEIKHEPRRFYMSSSLVDLIKILVFSSVLFVWVVRYKNLVEEFRFYNYPEWLRDLVGIVKISLVIMIMRENVQLVKLGAIGIMILMLAAMMTHLRVKNPFNKMLPSLVLFIFCSIIFYSTNQI